MSAAPLDPAELLSQLIRIPSVNPMGRPVSGLEFFEGRLTAFLSDLLKQWNIAHELHEVHAQRHNIVARCNADDEAPTLLFEVHQDTVPVDGMAR
ncbi:MAG: M20 family peptidase, partial [Planctomycetales bacterium]|nr:M20 family peptidase [Planctomycetales bacterium]